MDKFQQYTNNTIFKINDIVIPKSNNVWAIDNVDVKCLLSIYNNIIDFDNDDFVVTTDSFINNKNAAFKVVTNPKICRINNEVMPISIVKSENTDSLYLFDMRYVIKYNHKYGIPNKSHYIVHDNSWATITKAVSNNAKIIGVGNKIQLLRPNYNNAEYVNDIEEDDNFEDNNTVFIIDSYPYNKMINYPNNKTKFYEFINVYSPITNNKYSVLYKKENEIA